MDNYLSIYTDGSSAPKPRTGGVGFRIIFPDGEYKDYQPFGYKGATNNEMELQAPVLALKEVLKLEDLKGSQKIIIFTDSEYVAGNYKTAMFSWPKQKWMRSNGEPVLNTQQWKELLRLIKRVGATFRVYVDFEKVKAHSGIKNNEAVDKLAKKSRKGITKGGVSISNVRKKNTKKETERGSIIGEGQRIRIRPVSVQWLSAQKLYRARCEVVAKQNKYFGNVDFILSDFHIRGGHIYDVILMEGLDHCRIKKIIKEIKKLKDETAS